MLWLIKDRCVCSPGETTHWGVDGNNTHLSMINPLKIHLWLHICEFHYQIVCLFTLPALVIRYIWKSFWRHWPLCGEFTVDRWIPRTNGQQRGKCFHLMTSSCIGTNVPDMIFYIKGPRDTIACFLYDIRMSGNVQGGLRRPLFISVFAFRLYPWECDSALKQWHTYVLKH